MYLAISGGKSLTDFHGEIELSTFLLNTFHIGDHFYFIYYLPDQKIEYCSEGVTDVLNIGPESFSLEFLIENLHPEDLPIFMEFERRLINFLPSEIDSMNLTKYKVVYDYRVKVGKNSYKRIMHQVITLQNDDHSVIRTFGVFTDITHLKRSEKTQLDLIGLRGLPSYYNIQTDGSYSSSISPLSDRETEILSLMAEGYNSQEIAGIMRIAKNTVDNHRKSILKKTECNSSIEAMAKALDGRWI